MKTIENIFEYFYNETGIIFTEKKDIIAERIIRFADGCGYKDLEAYEQAIKSDNELFQKLVNRLSVNETYFFREPRAFEILIDSFNKEGHNKILTIPSSTGEETYTVCMILREIGLTNFEILGCDIDTEVLQIAAKGVYQKKSLRKIEKKIEEKYFTHLGNEYTIDESLKKHITFRQTNIFSHNTLKLGSFDFVFCRNLFIYFDVESKIRAEKVLYSLLKPGGILFMGHADYPENKIGFEKIFSHGMYYYRKP